MPSYRVLKTITCGFEPGEIRRADEFPKGFEVPRLLEQGAIQPLEPIDVLPGKPVSAEMLDQIEDLNESLATCKEHYEGRLIEKDAELNGCRKKLDEARATIAKLSDDLAAAKFAAESEIADLKSKLDEARATIDAKPVEPKQESQPADPDPKPDDKPPAEKPGKKK